jgi:hypothetical protein
MFNPPRHGGAAGLDETYLIRRIGSDVLDQTYWIRLGPAQRARPLLLGAADRPFFFGILPAIRRVFREPIPLLSRPNRETRIGRAGLAMRHD